MVHEMVNGKWSSLPASLIADEVNEKLRSNPCLVVTAPPGAGKSTLLPLTIREALGERVLVLEPRRMAARQIAIRMAQMMGEEVGQTIGYRVRFEGCVSASTQVEVVTEGILTRMLLDDPSLEGVGCVIFDEYHERSIHSDVALTLARESQQILRPDLRLVIMSATIDAESMCHTLNAPLVESQGRMFPVDIKRFDEEADARNVAQVVARCILRAHREHEGDILAFLPGQGEIVRCHELLRDAFGDADTSVYPLYGQLSTQEQQQAIAPCVSGRRKVVLATNIAETSLTIEGVRIVVDSGLCRTLVFDARTGLSRLQTVPISLDMATQRSGRAGRLCEGVCYRLWSLASEHRMAECRTPEILEADLSSMLLDMAVWQGCATVESVLSMPWMTPPPASQLKLAQQLLCSLGALDADGKLTPHGRKLAQLPCHPRISQMLTLADAQHHQSLACDIASLLEEKDIFSASSDASFFVRGVSVTSRLQLLCEARRRHSLRQLERYERIASQYRRMLRLSASHNEVDEEQVAMMIASAYPERIARLQKDGSYLLANGNNATLMPDDELCGHEWLAVADLNALAGGRIFLAAPLSLSAIPHLITTYDNVQWDSKQGRVVMQRERRIGRLLVSATPIQDVPRERVTDIICEACKKDGLSMFCFDEAVESLQQRVAAVSQWHPEMALPDLSTPALLQDAVKWLPFYIGKASSVAELRRIDLSEAVWSLLAYEQQQEIDRLAPTHLQVPTGSRIRVEYRSAAELPVLRVRLQECFGLTDTPRVDGGARPVLMELLSPGFKPVQLTQDLQSFWANTYFEVRKELRRRYPKHYWPDNPLEAEPTRGTKRSK